MPGPSTLQRGNINLEMILAVNIAASTVGSTTAALVTVSVPGLQVGDMISLVPNVSTWPASQPALILDQVGYVAASNVLSVSFVNGTGAAATQTTAISYLVNVCRVENYPINATYPSSIV